MADFLPRGFLVAAASHPMSGAEAYRPRIADRLLAAALRSSGAVLIEGPRNCGKTRTAQQAARSEVLLDVDVNARALLDISPAAVLAGDVPRLIDEWQLSATTVWNQVRRAVDERSKPGQFILTGSSVPDDDAERHSGAGRFAVVRMRPMALVESGVSTAQVSLAKLFDGEPAACPDPGYQLGDFIDMVCVGGWPSLVGSLVDDALAANANYLEQIRQVDMPRLGDGRRDPQRVGRFLASFARHTATPASRSRMARDTGQEQPLALTTIADYIDALERLLIIDDLPAWSVHLRSSATLQSTPKRLFCDPSLAVAALAATPQRLRNDLETFGLLFEALVIRDLRILSQPLRGRVFHARDQRGREADAIIELPDGRWGAVEVKLGGSQLDRAAANLLSFAADVDTSRITAPAFLAIVTGSNYGYRRPDGVNVIPLAALTT